MDYILDGMRTDRRRKNELTRMGKKMDYGLIGIIMDRGRGKEPTKVGKSFQKNVGVKRGVGVTVSMLNPMKGW